MGKNGRHVPYAALWVSALAFGWIEAAAVIYLRQISPHDLNAVGLVQFPLLSLQSRLIEVEIIREACTLILLAAVSVVISRRWAGRIGAFLLLFGVWDLAYYASLRLVLGWPEAWTTWDVLFLIPRPWVAPVWAPTIIATIFVGAGTYLFWTDAQPRTYTRHDTAILVASAIAVITAFLNESRFALDRQMTPRFPLWLFFAAVVCGVAWFLRVEWRERPRIVAPSPWLGVSVRAIPPNSHETNRLASRSVRKRAGPTAGVRDPSVEHLRAEYDTASGQLTTLLEEASDLGARLERLGHALSAHPIHVVIGPPNGRTDGSAPVDVISNEPLPTIDQLTALTNRVRDMSDRVTDLGKRLILLGEGELVEKPAEFFQ